MTWSFADGRVGGEGSSEDCSERLVAPEMHKLNWTLRANYGTARECEQAPTQRGPGQERDS
jgi:hypothetical protein